MYTERASYTTTTNTAHRAFVTTVLLVFLSQQLPSAMSFNPLININRIRTALNVLSSPTPRQRSINIDKGMFSTNLSIKTVTTKPTTNTNMNTIKPLIVCGPSGVGKGTIIAKYMEELNGSDKFGFTVSHTTRSPRPGEVDGIHYHFTTITSIKDAIQKNEFLEFAEVHGNWYGTSLKSLSFVQDVDNKMPLLDIDVQGVKNVKAWQRNQNLGENVGVPGPNLDAKFIFIAPPSAETLKERLVGRGTETAESLEKRTKNALLELDYGFEEGNFDAIIVNDDLEKACLDFKNAIEEIYGR
jgi:guanylate kinase